MRSNIVGIEKISLNAESKLSEYELDEYCNLTEYKREDFLLGRIALKQAISSHTGKDFDQKVTIKNSKSGRPYINDKNNFFCSISHSYGRGIGIVSPFKVGADIEKVRSHDRSLLNYIADIEEVNLVCDFFGNQTDVITLIWVIKESVMKGMGVGLKLPPKHVMITKMTSTRSHFQVNIVDRESSLTWYVWPIKKNDFYIGIAYEKEHREEPNIHWYRDTCLQAAEN